MSLFLCTNSGQFAWESKETTFIIATKGAKYIGINLTKQVKDLYTKMMKEMKDARSCSWIGRQHFKNVHNIQSNVQI